MTETPDVLFVDDEPNVLSGIRRQLRRQFTVDTAVGPEEGLAKVRECPYPVIVTDMRMPGMNGAQFLRRARQIHPHAVRMVLSGEASIDAAIDAVNDGSIFRYLRKPTNSATLAQGVQDALARYRTQETERDLLDRTVGGAIETLSEALQLAHPTAFRTTSRVARIAQDLGGHLDIDRSWDLRIASSLVFIGCIALSEKTLLDAMEADNPHADYTRHATIGSELIRRIPRLEGAADVVASHVLPMTPAERDDFDDVGPIRQAAIVLGLAVHADRLVSIGLSKVQVLSKLQSHVNPVMLKALSLARIAPDGEYDLKTLSIDDLEVGMIAAEPILTSAGLKLMNKDAEITRAMRTRIVNFHRTVGCREPVRVSVLRP